MNIQQGWQCPVCKKVMSPTAVMCMNVICKEPVDPFANAPTWNNGDNITISKCDHDWDLSAFSLTAPPKFRCKKCREYKIWNSTEPML